MLAVAVLLSLLALSQAAAAESLAACQTGQPLSHSGGAPKPANLQTLSHGGGAPKPADLGAAQTLTHSGGAPKPAELAATLTHSGGAPKPADLGAAQTLTHGGGAPKPAELAAGQTLSHGGGAPKPTDLAATQTLGACQPLAEQPSSSAQAAAEAVKTSPRGFIQRLLEVLGRRSR
jgi:hypothetical protein